MLRSSQIIHFAYVLVGAGTRPVLPFPCRAVEVEAVLREVARRVTFVEVGVDDFKSLVPGPLALSVPVIATGPPILVSIGELH